MCHGWFVCKSSMKGRKKRYYLSSSGYHEIPSLQNKNKIMWIITSQEITWWLKIKCQQLLIYQENIVMIIGFKHPLVNKIVFLRRCVACVLLVYALLVWSFCSDFCNLFCRPVVMINIVTCDICWLNHYKETIHCSVYVKLQRTYWWIKWYFLIWNKILLAFEMIDRCPPFCIEKM